jgi:hypothetical protein
MIPPFNDEGNIPPGIYLATMDEIDKRFAYNIQRRLLFSKLECFVRDIAQIGCETIYLDGSFVTIKELPNDMDICWDHQGIDLDNALRMMPVLFEMNFPRRSQQIMYMADIFPAKIIEGSSGILFLTFFQTDKQTGNPKGILQINLK